MSVETIAADRMPETVMNTISGQTFSQMEPYGDRNKMPTKSRLSQLDAFLLQLGNPGRYQMLLYFLSCMLYFVIAPSNLAMVFFGAAPSQFRCTDAEFVKYFIESSWVNATGRALLFDIGVSPSARFLSAIIKPADMQQCSISSSNDSNEFYCTNWRFPTVEDAFTEGNTIVSQYQLVCDNKWKTNFVTTLYFVGTMVGAPTFGYLSDRFGRRIVVLAATATVVIFSIAAAFAPNFAAFAILRFFVGVFVQGVQVFYVLMMEWFPTHRRAVLGTLSECIWGTAVITLALWGYIFPNWRDIQLAIAITAAVLLIIHIFLMKESLRWLLVAGKNTEAAVISTQVLRFNKLETNFSKDMESDLLHIGKKLQEQEGEKHYSFIDCFRTAKMRKVTLFLMYIWFSLAMAYYGLSFSINQLVGNTALNLFIGGVLEMVPPVACSFAVSRFGRKWPLMISSIISGVACIITGIIPNEGAGATARTVLAQIGRMATSGSFCTVIVWTTELFPTIIRSNGVGMAMFGLRLGGVICPQIALLGNYTFEQLPVIVFGVCILLGAVLAYFLEETRNKSSLPDTLEDAENIPDLDNVSLPTNGNATKSV